MKKIVKLKDRPFKLQFLLIILLVLFALLPTMINNLVLKNTFITSGIEARKIEIKNQGLIISDKLTRNKYLKQNTKDAIIDAQIETIASTLGGRIVIVGSDFSIIKDTFNMSVGKKSVAEEIIRCFNGEETGVYNKQKNYIIQTLPIYSSDDNKSVEGAILITASTESLYELLNSSGDRSLILIIIGFISIILSIILSRIIVAPFLRLKESLLKVAGGNLGYSVSENTYELTKEISDNINLTLNQLRTIDASRDEFVANVSHELKTPITSIRVLADSLMSMDEVPNELYKEFMNDISYEIDRESKIIDDLLSLVKLDKANADINTELTNINELIQLTLKRLRPIASKRNIEIIFESIRDVEAEVDDTKLSLAFNNLVENAIKYNVDGGFVRVSLDADHKFFYAKVVDSGVGIAPEFQEVIFDRFYRVDKARSRETGGTGLGLSITKNIVLLHNGIIKVSGQEGEGSSFTVRIPLKQIR